MYCHSNIWAFLTKSVLSIRSYVITLNSNYFTSFRRQKSSYAEEGLASKRWKLTPIFLRPIPNVVHHANDVANLWCNDTSLADKRSHHVRAIGYRTARPKLAVLIRRPALLDPLDIWCLLLH